MKKLLTAVACAAALCAGGLAHAEVLTFNNPGLVDIDNDTFVATYTESGFTISGQAAAFLPLDNALAGGFDGTPFSLKALGGGFFSLLSLDYAPYRFSPDDPVDPNATLTLVGLGGAMPVEQIFNLSSSGTAVFGQEWAHLTEVTFTGTGLFSVDNISAVPEPSRLALAAIGLIGVVAAVRKRSTVG